MYLTHLLIVTNGLEIKESHCVGINPCYMRNGAKILYEHAGTKEKFSTWLSALKLTRKQKLSQIIQHGEKAEIIYHAPEEFKEGAMSFAEIAIAKGISDLKQLLNINVGRTLLHGIAFDMNNQCWSAFQYVGGTTTITMELLDMPREIQQNLF